jgi:hypothetical protein
LRRLLLSLLFLLCTAADGPQPPASDGPGEVVFRGNYWRDRNTRVLQPEADFQKELPTGTLIGGHYLLDTITSASANAGAMRDQPFTELRHEVGFRLGQRAGPALMTAAYSYSSESDYWAHLISVGTSVDLFQHNTTLALSMSYGLDDVALRMGPTVYNPLGGLQTFNVQAGWSQILTPTLLFNLSYELGVIGFGSEKGSLTGSPNRFTGFQSNPYRMVSLGGQQVREVTPFQRIRQAAALAMHWAIPTGGRIVPFIGFRPAFRFYWDDWSVMSFTPELRTYVPIGPVEVRVTGRYYQQTEASFWSDVAGQPSYPDGHGRPCRACVADSSKGTLFYTGDPKLSPFSSMYLELRLLVRLSGIARARKLPLAKWLGAGTVDLSYGHYFNDRYAHAAFGDADVAALSFAFPL